MIKRVYYIVIVILISSSCDDLIVKKENQEKLLKEKWNEIDRNQVEQPPLFTTCRLAEEEELESCFQNTITKHINDHLSDQTIVVNKAINDTIWIPIVITKKGEIQIEKYTVPQIIKSQIPHFTDLIKESIHKLPDVKPAHTRSTPVSTRYKLPLVININ